jgi:Fe-S oxidoreductase
MESVTKNFGKHKVFYCLECGKCTAVCPVSDFDSGFSPRKMLADGIFYGGSNLISDNRLWSCLTCLLCSQRCPVDVQYSEYVRNIREEAYRQGQYGNPSHGSALLYIMEMTAAPGLKQSRTGWIDNKLKVGKKADVLFFTGCLPYYHEFFAKDFAFEPISIARDALKILNYLGIKPAVLDNERCCGHDLYWLGQDEKFEQLGRLNLKEIEKSKAKTIVTACPECAYTLKEIYKEKLGANSFEVKHISEIVAENLGRLKFNDLDLEITFQDPCRLGRYLGIYDQPRESLKAIPGVRLYEMSHSKRGAICCGITNWMNCGTSSHQIQRSRLTEARDTGAKVLVTACPKCRIHFQCFQCGQGDNEKTNIELRDFTNIIASAIDR